MTTTIFRLQGQHLLLSSQCPQRKSGQLQSSKQYRQPRRPPNAHVGKLRPPSRVRREPR